MNSYLEIINNINKYDKSLSEIEYIPVKEKSRILNEFNSDICKIKSNKYYYEEFSKIAKQYPDKCAIVFNDIKISYKKLDEMSNSLAHYLRTKNVGREDIIPIISDRSPYFIISTLAISKSGGAFLPIDIKLPIERIQFILNEANPKIILFSNTQKIINELLYLNEDYQIYNVQQHNYKLNINSIKNINKPNDTCYVLFTSGTTGKPKGVLISHFNIYYNIRNFDEENFKNLNIYNLIKKYEINNILGITNFSFDISQYEITFSLTHGLTIILVDDSISENIKLLSDIILKNNVEFIDTTPTRFKLFMEYKEFRKCLINIKMVILGGETFSIDLCKNIHQYSNCKIFNAYGPTECTVTSTFKEIDFENKNKITIGKPICNYQLYILDKYLKPVPVGVEGEIYIAGYGVGKGYLNREDLTKEKFIKNPFNIECDQHNNIMYRTGDLGKWTSNGEIEYLGRIDFQVKIHGQRIELGEIENIIQEINEIKQCVVIDKKKENGEKYLVCYYISEKEIYNKEIRNYLSKKLPRYMIPNYYKRIFVIPHTNSGKLNRKELPEINKEDFIKEEYIAPETEIEKTICKIYSKIFNIPDKEIGRTSDFFELGGDSLDAIKILQQIKGMLNVDLNVKNIFNNSTIKLLADLLENKIKNCDNKNKVYEIKKYERNEYPITYLLDSANFDINENELNNYSFDNLLQNMYIYIKLPNDININKLIDALNKLFDRNEILKTIFVEKEINGQKKIYGNIRKNAKLKIEHYTIKNFKQFVKPFDIFKDLLIRVGLIENIVLMIGLNHYIGDGYSLGVLIEDLYKIYNNELLQELPIQYSDFANYYDEKIKTENFTEEINYYKSLYNENFKNDIILYKMKKRIKNNEKELKSINMKADFETYDIINKISMKNNLSKSAILLTIYSLVLSIYSNQRCIFSSIIDLNRNNFYNEKLIGYFIRNVPVLLTIEDIRLIDLMKKCMDILLNVCSYNIPFKRVSKELNLPLCNLQFKFDPYHMINNDKLEYFKLINPKDIYKLFNREDLYKETDMIMKQNSMKNPHSSDLNLYITEMKSNYEFNFVYNSNLYDEDLIKDLMNKIIYIIKKMKYCDINVKNIRNEIISNNPFI